MSVKVQLKKYILSILVLTLLVVLTAVNVSPVRADGPDVAKPIAGLGKVTNADLTAMYLKERSWYDSQISIIRDANKLVSLFDSYITWMQGRSRDTTALEQAVATFRQAILATEASRAETNKLFTRNAGFNGFFYVLDRDSAGRTVLEVHDSLKGTHLDLMLATKALNDAYHTWRQWYLNTGH